MAGTIVVDRIESDSSYASTINVASKINFTGGVQVGGQDSPMAGFKNKIQNGDFRIWQRSTLYTANTNSTPGANSSVYVGPDRFKSYHYNEKNQWVPTYTIQQTKDHPSFGSSGNCLEYVCNTAASMPSYAAGGLCFHSILHHPEAQDVFDFVTDSRKPFTVSFWVKTNKVGTYSMHVRIPSPTGTNGNMMRAYTVNQSGVWEKKTLVFPSSSSVGCANITAPTAQGLGIEWIVATNYTPASDSGLNVMNEQWGLVNTYGSASTGQVNLHDTVNNYFRITDIQLEVGTVATEFERRPYGAELAICQRYLYRIIGDSNSMFAYGYAINTTGCHAGITFPVIMRAAPSLSTSAANTFYIQSATVNTTPTTFTYQTVSKYNSSLDVGGGASLVSGEGVQLLDKSGSYIQFSVEL
jgi:hypothetical protein